MTSAAPITGTSGPAASESFAPQTGRPVCLTLVWSAPGSAKVQKSRDGGATWADMTIAGRPTAVFTANCDEAFDFAGDNDVRYRLFIVSGTVTYRLGH